MARGHLSVTPDADSDCSIEDDSDFQWSEQWRGGCVLLENASLRLVCQYDLTCDFVIGPKMRTGTAVDADLGHKFAQLHREDGWKGCSLAVCTINTMCCIEERFDGIL